ncbi:hypothetical protein H2248_007893 [Termitomyces sp. 'cryptogamus']|nr:hypothetical protein H2248_007893 [Termitomyces sp. 'cryptogamus']
MYTHPHTTRTPQPEMVCSTRAADQRKSARVVASRRQADVTTYTYTYKLVKADKPDLRQIRDSEGDLWFMVEEQRHYSDYTRSGRHHQPMDNYDNRDYDGTTTSRGLQKTQKKLGGSHTMFISSDVNPQQHPALVTVSSNASMKKGQGEHRGNSRTFVADTAFEARCCTTPQDAEWAQWAIHAASMRKGSKRVRFRRGDVNSKGGTTP